MDRKRENYVQSKKIFCLFCMVIFCSSRVGCGVFSNVKPDAGRFPTATSTMAGEIFVTDIPEKNPCKGISGMLELQILVGPSKVIGSKPTSVGQIPFDVISDGEIFTIRGVGPIDNYVETESYEWGTYTVTFDGDAVVRVIVCQEIAAGC